MHVRYKRMKNQLFRTILQIQIGREGIAGDDDDIFLSESEDEEEGEALEEQFEPSAVQLCNR